VCVTLHFPIFPLSDGGVCRAFVCGSRQLVLCCVLPAVACFRAFFLHVDKFGCEGGPGVAAAVDPVSLSVPAVELMDVDVDVYVVVDVVGVDLNVIVGGGFDGAACGCAASCRCGGLFGAAVGSVVLVETVRRCRDYPIDCSDVSLINICGAMRPRSTASDGGLGSRVRGQQTAGHGGWRRRAEQRVAGSVRSEGRDVSGTVVATLAAASGCPVWCAAPLRLRSSSGCEQAGGRRSRAGSSVLSEGCVVAVPVSVRVAAGGLLLPFLEARAAFGARVRPMRRRRGCCAMTQRSRGDFVSQCPTDPDGYDSLLISVPALQGGNVHLISRARSHGSQLMAAALIFLQATTA